MVYLAYYTGIQIPLTKRILVLQHVPGMTGNEPDSADANVGQELVQHKIYHTFTFLFCDVYILFFHSFFLMTQFTDTIFTD